MLLKISINAIVFCVEQLKTIAMIGFDFQNELIGKESLIRNVAKKYLGSNYREWTDDVVQDVFFKVLKNPEAYRMNGGKFESWLHTVTKNYCFDLMSKKANCLSIKASLEHSDVIYNTFEVCIFENTFLSIKIKRALEMLPVRDKLLLTYKYFDHYTSNELADTLNIPKPQLGVYVGRAKMRLKKVLIEELNFSALDFEQLFND
jgi:RNA polymerase sigma-70 factor (ECF subfamily)